MTILRTLTIGIAAAMCLSTLNGCCSISVKKCQECDACQGGPACAEAMSPMTGPAPAVPLLIPTPVPAPSGQPSSVPQASPDIPAPPPPGEALRLSPIQTMRHHTAEFFRSANANVRAVFAR